jgi:PAS domain S-box-containing protein
MLATPDAKLFELMTERVQDYAIFLLDPEGRIVSWNAGAAAIKQYSAAEIVGKHFSIFYTAADMARDWPAFELERATIEGRFEDEGWRVRKDGSRFWANVVITALRDDAGKLLAFSKITRDMTERKAQEEALRQSEERFRLLVDGVQDYAIYMLSPDGIVTSWNLGARRIKGYEAADIIGKHCSRFYTAEDIQSGRPWSELATARDMGRAEDEGWRLRKDGTRFWARVVVTALYDNSGKLQGFAKVTQDLTQRQHSEALETSASNLNDFIAILAHELRNPLAPIRNAVQLQKSVKPGDPLHEKALQIIDRQSGQLARIVDDLIDINRVTRGTFSMTRKPTSVAAIVERAVETARPAIESARHTLEVDVAPEAMTVDADELRLTQALTNILNNAARYTDPGGKIFLKVSVIEGHVQPKARIAVRDTGRGIDPSLLNSIFGMFVQGKDPLGRPAAGLGVGLALARSIVELHRGTVEAASAGTGKGAEFAIILPLVSAPARADETPLDASERDTESTLADAPRYRILVVDDNADAAAALASLLKTHGHEVVAVNEGADALNASEGFRPQIILLDVGMPGMNGFELARSLRERNGSPRPFIVAVTGWAKLEDEARSREAGFDLHLLKPVDEPELLKMIETHSQSIH